MIPVLVLQIARREARMSVGPKEPWAHLVKSFKRLPGEEGMDLLADRDQKVEWGMTIKVGHPFKTRYDCCDLQGRKLIVLRELNLDTGEMSVEVWEPALPLGVEFPWFEDYPA